MNTKNYVKPTTKIIDAWRDIPGYEGYYQSSVYGEIRSVPRTVYGEGCIKVKHLDGKILSQTNNKTGKGYMFVRLSKNGQTKEMYTHKAVSLTWIPNPHNYKEINHKDENPANNCAWNLEWCDRTYNCNYGTRNKRVSKSNVNGKKSKPVVQYTKDGKTLLKIWDSASEVQRQTGWYQAAISRCARGYEGCYSAYGYKWKYMN